MSEINAEQRLEIERDENARIIRDILVAIAERDGISLESKVCPGEPARNYELTDRLGIGHIWLKDLTSKLQDPRTVVNELRTQKRDVSTRKDENRP